MTDYPSSNTTDRSLSHFQYGVEFSDYTLREPQTPSLSHPDMCDLDMTYDVPIRSLSYLVNVFCACSCNAVCDVRR